MVLKYDGRKRMTRTTSRFRLTIASLMALVAAFAVLWALVLPIVRQGRPPCLGTPATARWLVRNPGSASCNDCHRSVKIADRLLALLPLPAKATPAVKPTHTQLASARACPAAIGQATTSCVACHGN
jgi:hypothetical protein